MGTIFPKLVFYGAFSTAPDQSGDVFKASNRHRAATAAAAMLTLIDGIIELITGRFIDGEGSRRSQKLENNGNRILLLKMDLWIL